MSVCIANCKRLHHPLAHITDSLSRVEVTLKAHTIGELDPNESAGIHSFSLCSLEVPHCLGGERSVLVGAFESAEQCLGDDAAVS